MTRIALALLLTACSGGAADIPDPPKEGQAKSEPSHDGHDHGNDHGHDHDKPDAATPDKPAAGAKVMFVSPADGDKVKSPLKVVMGVEGMTIQPAGDLKAGTGHHHLIIDSDPVAFGTAVPADETHIHFGKGETEAEVELEPGEHKLMLQLADGVHRSYGEQMSATITVTVEK